MSANTSRGDVEVSYQVPIPTRDGLALFADVYQPPGGGDVPTIITRTPYGKAFFRDSAHYLAEHGYYVVLQDCRGAGGSPGEPSFFAEGPDGADCAAWVADQPWFNGQLAVHGGSYLGFTALMLAATNPPNLEAISVQIYGSERRRAWYPGDSFALDLALPWTQIRVATRDGLFELSDRTQMEAAMVDLNRRLNEAFMHLPLADADRIAIGESTDWWHDWLVHNERGDPFWDSLDLRAKLLELRLPTLLIDGWYDYQVPAMIDDYNMLLAAGVPTRLVVGPWYHSATDPSVTTLEARRWFDLHLKGIEPERPLSPVTVFVMPEAGWRDLDAWPPRPATHRWQLQPGGGLALDLAPQSEPTKYSYDPADPTPQFGGTSLRAAPHAGPVDNRDLEARDDVLVFTSEVFAEPYEIVGPVHAELYITSSTRFTDFFVRLNDVFPDGRSINICDGLQRFDLGTLMPDAEGVLAVRVALWDTAYRFEPGHRLRVLVSSGSHPRYARNPGSGEPLATATTLVVAHQRVFHDASRPSSVVVTV